jgi:hypothetical protein
MLVGEVVGGVALGVGIHPATNIHDNLTAPTADANNVMSITATDGLQVTVGNGLFVADKAALDKISGGFSILGQASVLSGNLDGLQADIIHINSIAGLNGMITGTVANFTHDELALNKVVGGFNVADFAANVAAGLDALQGDVSHIGAITLSDATMPTINVTPAQNIADAAVIAKITSPYTLHVI